MKRKIGISNSATLETFPNEYPERNCFIAYTIDNPFEVTVRYIPDQKVVGDIGEYVDELETSLEYNYHDQFVAHVLLNDFVKFVEPKYVEVEVFTERGFYVSYGIPNTKYEQLATQRMNLFGFNSI